MVEPAATGGSFTQAAQEALKQRRDAAAANARASAAAAAAAARRASDEAAAEALLARLLRLAQAAEQGALGLAAAQAAAAEGMARAPFHVRALAEAKLPASERSALKLKARPSLPTTEISPMTTLPARSGAFLSVRDVPTCMRSGYHLTPPTPLR